MVLRGILYFVQHFLHLDLLLVHQQEVIVHLKRSMHFLHYHLQCMACDYFYYCYSHCSLLFLYVILLEEELAIDYHYYSDCSQHQCHQYHHHRHHQQNHQKNHLLTDRWRLNCIHHCFQHLNDAHYSCCLHQIQLVHHLHHRHHPHPHHHQHLYLLHFHSDYCHLFQY